MSTTFNVKMTYICFPRMENEEKKKMCNIINLCHDCNKTITLS